MKAVQFASYGGPEVLDVVESGQPAIGIGQVLVEVYAASINPIDYKVREGYLKDMVPLHLPITIGGDFSGVVRKAADDVVDFKAGDLVCGQATVLGGGSGSCAEFVAANISSIARKPERADFIEAAALPLAGVSALQAIEDHLKLSSGRRILIHGGAGGIGTFAVQIAKSIGAWVATTVSGNNISFVKELGADEAIDYHAAGFESTLKNFDAVLDTAGGDTTTRSLQALKRGGVLVSLAGLPDTSLIEQNGITAVGQRTMTDTQHLQRLAGLVDSEKIRICIDSIFPMDQVRDAFTHAEKDHIRGKVVVKIK